MKTVTLDDHLTRMDAALAYIESGLCDRLTLGEIARRSRQSPFYFSRIFHAHVGRTLKEYVTARRITEAAHRLIETNVPLITIALDYQFGSQEAFTRAFKRQFEMTPARYRRRGKRILRGEVRRCTRVQLEHVVSGAVTAEPRPMRAGPLTLVGMRCTNSPGHIGIPVLWDGFLRRMGEIGDAIDSSTYGVYVWDFSLETKDVTDDIEFDYLAAMRVRGDDAPPTGMVMHRIPARDYLVFTHRGWLRDLAMTYEYIYRNWLPRCETELSPMEHFEYRDPSYEGDGPNGETHIFVPIGDAMPASAEPEAAREAQKEEPS